MTDALAAVLGLPKGMSVPHSGAVELPDGRSVFVKHGDKGNIAAEVNGLRWLGEVEELAVPAVVAHADGALATELIRTGRPTPEAADALGRSLASLHDAPCSAFGAPWPGFIGPLPQDNDAAGEGWTEFYWARRVEPFLRRAYDGGTIGDEGLRAVSQVCEHLPQLAGPAESPSRIHGDLWSGNVVWGQDGKAWVVDPAAHGGHRETDLAMLNLFGCPYLDRVIAAYQEVHPLADGWRRRIPLHQLHPLLVHAVLFGSSYGRQATEAAQTLLARAR